MCVCAERYKGAHFGEGREISILIGLQDRDHVASIGVQARQEFGGHALAIHNHPCDLAVSRMLFIPLQKCGNARCQMLIATMGSGEERMTVLVMQQKERSATQDDAQTSNQSAREEHVAVDRLAMSVHIAGERIVLFGFSCFSHWVPEVRSPAGKGRGPALNSIEADDVRQKGFCVVAIPIGMRSPCKECQAVGGIAAQTPGAL